MTRMDQPGSEPLDVPQQIPKRVPVPRRRERIPQAPTPSPVKIPERVSEARHSPGLLFYMATAMRVFGPKYPTEGKMLFAD